MSESTGIERHLEELNALHRRFEGRSGFVDAAEVVLSRFRMEIIRANHRRSKRRVIEWIEANPDVRVTHAELGQQIGADRETVSRALKKLIADRAVKQSQHTMCRAYRVNGAG